MLEGDHTGLTAHPDRALFLCWPPLVSALGECLSHYRGSTVAYIGDYGHRTAVIDDLSTLFVRVLEVPVRALDPAPAVKATLSVWQRTNR